MTWLYMTGLVFILGGEINALFEHASREGKARGARAPGEAPPPVERPSVAAPGAAKTAEAAARTASRCSLGPFPQIARIGGPGQSVGERPINP